MIIYYREEVYSESIMNNDDYNLVTIGSANGLLPDGTKPIAEPKLTKSLSHIPMLIS